ncbi:MAG: hypothetical protein QW514_09330 [Thermoprotei archaeon]
MRAWPIYLAQLLAAALLAYVGYWYLLVVVAVAFGAYARDKVHLSLLGVASAIGVAIIVGAQSTGGGIGQAALLSHIIGVPGGPGLPLTLTLVYSFALGALGGYTGSALTLGRGESVGAEGSSQ